LGVDIWKYIFPSTPQFTALIYILAQTCQKIGKKNQKKILIPMVGYPT
jgi:hypothetical protein